LRSRKCRSRRVDELRSKPGRCVSAGWGLYRPHPQGRKASGAASRAVEQVRAGDQCRNRKDAWRYRANARARARGRGDRLMMRRREFIALLGGTVLPLSTLAQQTGITVVGFLSSRSPSESSNSTVAFRQGLSDVGFVEGQNLVIAFRWAEGRYDRLGALASDLVQLR